MKRNDLVTMMTVALTTATLTVAVFWAAPLEAGGEAETLSPEIAKPKLVAKGIEVTLTPVSGTENPGDEPVLELAAVNTAAQPAELNLRLSMTAMSPADALSRVVRIPGRLWEGEQSIVLGPKEQKTLKVTTKTKLPAKNMISVSVTEAVPSALGKDVLPLLQPVNTAKSGIAVLNFSTAGLEAALAAVGPRS